MRSLPCVDINTEICTLSCLFIYVDHKYFPIPIYNGYCNNIMYCGVISSYSTTWLESPGIGKFARQALEAITMHAMHQTELILCRCILRTKTLRSVRKASAISARSAMGLKPVLAAKFWVVANLSATSWSYVLYLALCIKLCVMQGASRSLNSSKKCFCSRDEFMPTCGLHRLFSAGTVERIQPWV